MLCGYYEAQRDLFLIHARYRAKYGQRAPCIPSRFLSEIPEEVIEEIDKTNYSSYSDELQTGYAERSGENSGTGDYLHYDDEENVHDVTDEFQHEVSQDSSNLVPGGYCKSRILWPWENYKNYSIYKYGIC